MLYDTISFGSYGEEKGQTQKWFCDGQQGKTARRGELCLSEVSFQVIYTGGAA